MSLVIRKQLGEISYSIRNSSSRRRVLITVGSDMQVIVSKPKHVSIEKIEMLMKEKIDWVREKIEIQASRPQKLLSHYSPRDFKENKEKARELVALRLDYFNNFYQHKIGKVYIRNQKSRWGSCSSKGNLNFNYKILFLPKELCDYLIVHELCHIKEMNHGHAFWNLVALKIPNYKDIQKKLRAY